MLNQRRIKRDVYCIAQHLPPYVWQPERLLGPAINRRPSPLAEETPPRCDRARSARRIGRYELRAEISHYAKSM